MSDRRQSPNVHGIETEYSCMITLPGDVVHEIVGACHSPDAELGLYREPSKKGIDDVAATAIDEALRSLDIHRNGTGMLSNGGRLYVDPSGPEYDTPEVTTAEEAVTRSFDGDTIMLGVFDWLRREGFIKGYQINRRIVDHNRSSRGIHLNTSTILHNKEPNGLVRAWLATLNVSKGAIFGSGGLLLNDEGQTEFHHSPRLSLTTEEADEYGNYRQRPLVRYPFKEDGPGTRLGRIETVTSDALNFAWPLRASLVATNAVVKLIEHGYGDKLPRLSDPVYAAETVGLHGNEEGIYKIGRHGEPALVKPLDLMRQICELLLTSDETLEYLDEESYQVLHEIIEVADKMTADPYSVVNQVESMARLAVMEQRMERGKLTLDSETMCRYDYAWDVLGGGIAESLRRKGIGWQGFSNAPPATRSQKHISTPPQDTRAHARGNAIREHGSKKNRSTWSTIDFGDAQRYVGPLDT